MYIVEDAHGKPVSRESSVGLSVFAEIKYELRPYPHQPLNVEIYGRNLPGFGQTKERLELDNGVILTGRAHGGRIGGKRDEISKIRLLDIEEQKIELWPTDVSSNPSSVDAIIFGVVSSNPLGYDNCSNGAAQPGFPFSFRESIPDNCKRRWSNFALRLNYERLEITFVETSNYWRRFVGSGPLHHDMIAGIRRCDGRILDWDEINRATSLLSKFLGWINHCSSPVFHIKGYRNGKLVYRGFNLHPHATDCRDEFSWLPMSIPNFDHANSTQMIQSLLNKFAISLADNDEQSGVFHIALDMLRSRSKGYPRHRAAIRYLSDTCSACRILVSILIRPERCTTRCVAISKCLKVIGIEDKIPLSSKDDRDWVVENCAQLWSKPRQDEILEDEKGTLSRSLSNLENWLVHIDEPENADKLLNIPNSIQQLFVEVAAWLADLMVLKVLGYEGWYFTMGK